MIKKVMIKEAYCSDDICKLLKEKGMDKEYFTHYIQKNNTDGTSEAVTTCTHQMAMAWLREVHNLCIYIYYLFPYGYTIDILYTNKETPFTAYRLIRKKVFNTYEDAVEAALKSSLENLL